MSSNFNGCVSIFPLYGKKRHSQAPYLSAIVSFGQVDSRWYLLNQRKEKTLANLKVRQAARVLNVDDATIRRWMRAGSISYIRLSKRAVRIPQGEIDRLITEGTIPAAKKCVAR